MIQSVLERSKLGNRSTGKVKVLRILFDANTLVADCFCCRQGRPRACECIQYNSLTKRKNSSDDGPQESLWFQTGVRR